MVAPSRKVPVGVCARFRRSPCRGRDLRFWGAAPKAVEVQYLPFREKSGDPCQKATPVGLAVARRRRAIADLGASAPFSLMALFQYRPWRVVGRSERGNRNARIYANHSGTGDKSLFAARRLGSVRPLSRGAVGSPELAGLFRHQHEK